MSASDTKSFVIEIGEHNLLIARADLADKNRKVEAVREVWLGDNAAVENALNEMKAGASGGKAIILLRSKSRESYMADQAQASKVSSAAAVEALIKERFAAENLPAKWSWCTAKDGRAAGSGAVWLLDAHAGAQVDESIAKIKGWSFDPLRCESAGLALIGGIVASLKTAPVGTAVLVCDVSELRTHLVLLTSQGVVGLATAPVGFDTLAEATQTALGLKFRGSAARLMFNESYDFSDAAVKIVEPLANGLKTVFPSLGAIAPSHLVCSGILIKQAWLSQQLATALGLKNYAPDTTAWAKSVGVTIESGASAESASPNVLAALSALSAYDARNPGATSPWHVALTDTPVAPAPIVPAILFEDPPPAVIKPVAAPAPVVKAPEIPAIKAEPAKVTPPAAKVEPPKPTPTPAAKPEPAKPVTPAPKPAVVITPPPAKPADNKAAPVPVKGNVKPTPAPTPAPAKQPAPSSALKTPAKPEPGKPNTPPIAVPSSAKAPGKPVTAAPFPAKKSNNMPIIIGVVVLLLAAVIYFVIDNNKKSAEADRIAKESKAREEQVAQEAKAREEKLAKETKAREDQMAKERADEAARKEKEKQEAMAQASQATQAQLLNARGGLIVVTEPAGANITVGELAPVVSPYNRKDLRLGTYSIVITLPGYDTETRSVEIKPNETVDLGTLKLNRQAGSLELSSSPQGQTFEVRPEGTIFVSANEIRTGKTPFTIKDLPIGKYKVTISRAGWPNFVETHTVVRGGSYKSNAVFPNGTVNITSEPSGASVSKDGKVLGVTPLTLSDFPVGEASFTLSSNLMEDMVLTGLVEGGKNLALNATLLPTDRIMKPSELDIRPTAMGEPASPDISQLDISNPITVTITMTINRDGTPEDIKVDGANAIPGLNRACIVAASKWRFKPGMIKGQPVRTTVRLPFRITPNAGL